MGRSQEEPSSRLVASFPSSNSPFTGRWPRQSDSRRLSARILIPAGWREGGHSEGAQKPRSGGLQSMMATHPETVIKLGCFPRKQTLRRAEIYTEGSQGVPRNQHQWGASEEGLDWADEGSKGEEYRFHLLPQVLWSRDDSSGSPCPEARGPLPHLQWPVTAHRLSPSPVPAVMILGEGIFFQPRTIPGIASRLHSQQVDSERHRSGEHRKHCGQKWGFLGGSDGKGSAGSAGVLVGFDPWVGKIPWRRK